MAPCYCQRGTNERKKSDNARLRDREGMDYGRWGKGMQRRLQDRDEGDALLNLAYKGSEGSPNSSAVEAPVDERTGICGSVGDEGEPAIVRVSLSSF